MATQKNYDVKKSYQFNKMVDAIRKYKATPIISIAVVTNGPVDIAGSKLSFLRMIGTLAPTAVAIVMEQNICRLQN